MGILGWLALGFISGAIAKAVHHGPEPAGPLGTLVVGVFGALAGGTIASVLGIGSIESFFSLGTWLVAILGALLLLGLYGMATERLGSSRRGGSTMPRA